MWREPLQRYRLSDRSDRTPLGRVRVPIAHGWSEVYMRTSEGRHTCPAAPQAVLKHRALGCRII